MAQRYRPCTLRFRLEDVILDDVSDDTVSFVIDNRKQLGTDVLVDNDTGIVHITPRFSWEEMADYSLVFSKMLRLTGGHLLLRNYAVSFQIKDGKFFTRNNAGAPQGGELFAPANLFRYTRIVSARFDEVRRRVVLTYPDDEPEETGDGGETT